MLITCEPFIQFQQMTSHFVPVKDFNHLNTNWIIENYFQIYTVISAYTDLKLFKTTKSHFFSSLHISGKSRAIFHVTD